MSIRDEVRASAAAHSDLGPGYDAAVAEGLVERIGEEIDRRVDARMHGQALQQGPPPRPRLRREPAGRIGFGAVVLGLGSMGMAIGATAAVLHPGDSPGQVSGGAAVLIALIWIVIGAVNVAYARYRWLSAAHCGDPKQTVACAYDHHRGRQRRLRAASLITGSGARMFERFTDRARRVVVLAQEEARLLDHNWIGTEHILLGLIHEGQGVAARSLSALGISLHATRQAVEEIIGRGAQAPSGHIPFTPRSKKVLELSLREALSLGSDYIGTEHILLALLREGDGVGAQILAGAGVRLSQVRQQVIELLPSQDEQDAPAATVSAMRFASARLTVSAPPPTTDELVSRLMSFAARLHAIEQRLSASPAD